MTISVRKYPENCQRFLKNGWWYHHEISHDNLEDPSPMTYTETKKFSNTLQIRIFITEIHVEITQTE